MTTSATSPAPAPVIEPKTRDEYEKALAEAKGPVIVEFVQEGCGACDPTALDKLATDCGTKATIMRVECGSGFGSDVADELGVDGTPTALMAESGAKFLAKETVEVDPESTSLRRKLKCSR
jgi:hypothetical protein